MLRDLRKIVKVVYFHSKDSLDIQILNFCVQLVVINVHVDKPLKKRTTENKFKCKILMF